MTETDLLAERVFRIAVVSDLHAFDSASMQESPSTLDTARPETPESLHPLAGLRYLIDSVGLQADLLLCPGDLTHQAKAAPLAYAWAKLHELGHQLGATLVAGTAGNHDLDSRYHESVDAKGMLLELSPPFPLPDEVLNDRYWARNFAIADGRECRLVVLNSSAYHGGVQEEIDFGRVSSFTREALRRALSEREPKQINILLCHHHPQPQFTPDRGGGDEMRGGGELLEMLGSERRGTWLVIHGHKHHPKLAYGFGGASSPVVLSAASLCARVSPHSARNQFHLVSIRLADLRTFGLCGVIRSWDWIEGFGWATPSEHSGLPAKCGFGCREPLGVLASRIAASMTEDKHDWGAISSRVPVVEFLLPRDFTALRSELRQTHHLEILEAQGVPQQIGKIP